MQSIQYVKAKLNKWKEKAKARAKKNHYLLRENTRLRASRDKWKEKYLAERASRRSNKEQELSGIKPHLSNSVRPRCHQYSTLMILLSLWIRQSGNCSLRGCSSILSILSNQLGLGELSPSHNSIRNWELKVGYSRIAQRDYQEESWVIIPDESMCLGQECILLILGVPLSRYQLGKALSFEDVSVLSISIAKSWKSTQIDKVIEGLKAQGLEIAYAVSDGGLNLKKSLKTQHIARVADCTHALNNWVEKRYKKQQLFEQYSKDTAQFKKKTAMSKYAAYMPPRQRSKARFLNLGPLAKWGMKILKLIDQKHLEPYPELAQKLNWILTYRSLIEELNQVTNTLNDLFKILKNDGLSQDSAAQCRDILEASNSPAGLRLAVNKYLQENLERFPKRKKLICSSDIIESFFGKFKNKFKSSPNCGLTQSVLTIALYAGNFSSKEILSACQGTKIKDILKWRDDNLTINIAQKRKIAFKNVA